MILKKDGTLMDNYFMPFSFIKFFKCSKSLIYSKIT